jgi:hypothetical protein
MRCPANWHVIVGDCVGCVIPVPSLSAVNKLIKRFGQTNRQNKKSTAIWQPMEDA